jgi:CRISPR type I-E-associated protein CasB/Cse2
MSEEQNKQIYEFCGRLRGLKKGETARLKRAAGKTLSEASGAAQLLFYSLLPDGVERDEEEIYFLLATLYQLAKVSDTPASLGAVLHRHRLNLLNPESLDRRVRRLLEADKSRLPFLARQTIRLLADNEQRIHWPTLLKDILHWDSEKRFVQMRWARDYWATVADKKVVPAEELFPDSQD